jgi:hypothetical protein
MTAGSRAIGTSVAREFREEFYAANCGDFVLGGLQALFETEMDLFLRELVTSDLRFPLVRDALGSRRRAWPAFICASLPAATSIAFFDEPG